MRALEYIVIHHAAVDQPNINKLIQSMDRTHRERWLHTKANGFWHYIAYHFVIWVDWEVKPTRPISEFGNHASNAVVNRSSIGILLSWNLDLHKPTSEQIAALLFLINDLRKEHWEHLYIKYHRDFAKKSCPGNMFPYDLFNKMLTMTSKFKKIFEEEVKDPIFNVHDDNEPCTIADAKYLMEIGLARALPKVYKYIDDENKKERWILASITSFFKNI